MDPRYDRDELAGRKSFGITPKEEELLVRLMEECAELQQACAKVLRWGWESVNPDDVMDGTNRDRFHREAADVGALYSRLSKMPGHSVLDVDAAHRRALKTHSITPPRPRKRRAP